MLRVKTKIKESAINGIGLYAAEHIPKGTITWHYDPEFDTSYKVEDLDKLTPIQKEHFMTYAYFDHKRNIYILCSDFQRFINHSDNPNIDSTPDMDVASRDIEPGEELVCDYACYEHDWFERRDVKRQDFAL